MIYPTLVYICPGSHSYNGGTYDFIQVLSEDELKDRLKEGYKLTLVEATGEDAKVINEPKQKRGRHGVQKEI